MEEQLIQMTGLSSSSGCSTSGSSLEQTFQPDRKNSANEKDGAHAVAPMDVNDPSQLKNSNIIPSICAGLTSSHGFFAPATPSHPEQIGTSSSGVGGHTESSLNEEKEEEEEEGSFHHCQEGKEPEDGNEGEDTSIDLMRISEAAAAEAIDDDRRKYPHTECPSCPECTREFPSWKAVFGHMRSHPKRDWRGIRPTMQKNSVKNYIIFRSPVTGRRSKRTKPRPANPLRLLELNIEEQETAEFLLMLSDAARTIEEKDNNRLILPSLSSSSSSSLQVPAGLIETQSDSIANKEEENPLSHTIISKTDLCEDGKKVSEVMDKDTLRAMKKTASIDKGRYECSTCKKVFASHQALGGHRASHQKLKGCFARTVTNASGKETKEKSEPESEGEPEEKVVRKELNNDFLLYPPAPPPPPPPLPPINKGHQCSICLRVFETGQALGGHKRRHWNGERIVKQKKQKKREEKDEQREEAEEEEEEKRWLLFDLNLPPPVDEIDQFVLDAAHSKTILNPNNLLPQKAKAKTKKYYCCHLCNETFASREAFCKHQNSHASSSCIPVALTSPPNNLLVPPN